MLDVEYNLTKHFPLMIGRILNKAVRYDIITIVLAYVVGHVHMAIDN